MHHADAFERRVWFGSDSTNFYIRYDTPLPLAPGTEIRLTFHGRRAVTLSFTPSSVAMEASIDQSGRAVIAGLAAAIGETLEAAIPISHLDGEGVPPESVGIVCEIFEHGHQTERFPHQGEVVCPLGKSGIEDGK